MSLLEHRAVTRAGFANEIVTAASKELAKRGYEDLPLRDLAKKMGCAVGTLYLYFNDKHELLNAVVERGFQELLQAVESVPKSSDLLKTFRARFRAYVDFGLRNPNHYRCAFVLPRVASSKTYRPHAAFDVLRDNVRACIEAGLFRSADVELVSQTVWAAVHGLTSLLIARPDFPWLPTKKLVDGLTEAVIQGLRIPSVGRRRKP